MAHDVGIIASDLTGAMDCAVAFASAPGSTTVLLAGEQPAESPVAVVVTDSAAVAPNVAYTLARTAADRLSGRWLYKKIDSTLRGNIGPELCAVLDTFGGARAVVCPALPREGRTVRGGVALLKGVPVHLTSYGSHPVTPCRESHIPTLLRQAGVEAMLVSLDDVRRGPDHVRRLMGASRARVIVVDAETEEDLLAIANAIPLDDSTWVACGSSGLAAACATARGVSSSRVLHTTGVPGSTLAAIGSRNPTTVSQVAALETEVSCSVVDIDAAALCTRGGRGEADAWIQAVAEIFETGRTAVLTTSLCPLVPQFGSQVANRLGELVLAVAQRQRVDAFVLSGGATALSVCRQLGVETLVVKGELERGVVVAAALDGPHAGRLFITKAGGFGDNGTLARAFHTLR